MSEPRNDAAGRNESAKPAEPSAAPAHKAKSQIQQIIEGSSVTRKRYGIRSQPFGPQPATLTPNAARLSSVASSSEETYRGGRD